MAGPEPRIRELFSKAAECQTNEEQAAYLDQACQGNAELRAQLEELLQAHREAGSFLREPSARPSATIDLPAPAERPGAVIGPYKLLQQIGEGGMGTVFMAEQTQPVQRKVALKLIKAGMDSRQVIARFEAERQALAMMDHVNIARVLDAGTTEAGLPYFVMELVHGVPITKYCDDNCLTPRERLELFVPVCQAIQHAHQKGIIHRDIKPSNVMVTLYDGKPVPKVIDFGVAKATEQKLTELTLFTQYGAMVGTLEYMSPEQAEMSALGADTRSDIYSLGVLLYELLTGSTPLTHKRIKEGAYAEILRMIKEEEPPRPSTRLSDSGEALASISAQRHMEPAKLAKLVRGELDWIVMKTLEKDRNRRYETAKDFAADVQRYLSDEPVQACPPSAGYRLRKFVRRNKWAFVTASAAALVVLLALIGLAVSNVLISRENDEKVAALHQAKINEEAANTQRGLAEKNEVAAKAQRGIAEAEALRAKQQELLARRRFYAAQINLAHQAWVAGNPARVLELLEGQRPRLDQEDLRTFEWYYLWRLCHPGCRFTLRGHDRVLSIAYSPDGQILASAGGDSTIRLWHVSTGQERAILRGHTGLVWAVTFSPDHKTLASTGADQTVKLWDVATGKEVRTLGPAQEDNGSLAFTADGKTLAATAPTGITLWDVASGKEQATLRGPQHESFRSVAFSPDGKVLAANGVCQTVNLWTWDGGKWGEGTILAGHRWGTPLAFSPDGKTLATGSGWSAKLWDISTGKERAALQGHTRPTSTMGSVAFSPDGKTLATGSGDRTVRLWHLATGQVQFRQAHLAPVSSIAFSPDGKTLASGSVDGTIKVWDLAPVLDADTLQHTGPVHGVAFTPEGKTLLSVGAYPTQLWDVATGRVLPLKGYTGLIVSKGRLSPDHKTVASWDPGKAMKLWDAATGNERGSVPMEMRVDGAAFSPDGKTLATWGRQEGAIVNLWDLATGQTRGTLTTPLGEGSISVISVAFSPDGKTLAAGFEFHRLRVWDVATGQLKLSILQDHRGFPLVQAVLFSPDGKTLAAGTDAGTVRLWDADTGQLRAALKGHTNGIQSMAFSPDGKTLATGSEDTTAKLWDVATGQERMTLGAHKAAVTSVAFAPDGNVLATSSEDGTVKLWRAATVQEALAGKQGRDADDPDDPFVLSVAADRLCNSGRLEDAEKVYGRVIEVCTLAIEAHPEAAWIYECRAIAYVKRSQLEKAARDFEKATELTPGDALARYRVALVRLHLGDRDGYRKVCAGMVEHFGATANVDAAYWAVWTSTLAPDAVTDWQAVVQMGEKSLAADPKNCDKLQHLGAVLYRAGRFEEAAKRLIEAEAAFPETKNARSSIIYNWLFQAMSEHRLGRTDKAKEWLEKAIKDIKQPPQDRPSDGAARAWNRQLTLRLLRREAEELLKKKSAAKNHESE